MNENIYNLKIFQGLDKQTIDDIINNCSTRNYSEGEMILSEGSDSNGEGYILKQGSVSVSIGGKRIVSLNSGDIFGEIALLNEEKRTATIKALSDIEVIVLSFNDLIDIINNDRNNLNKTILKRIEENIERELSLE